MGVSSIYISDAIREVYLDVPVTATGGSMDVEVYDGDTKVFEPSTVSFDNGQYHFTLPFGLVFEVKTLLVVWKFSYIESGATRQLEQTTYIDIEKPLVSVRRARLELDIPSTISDDEIRRAERLVRTIIERVTGQQFYSYSGTELATELPDGSVRLPKRLVALTSVNGINNSLYYVIGDSGWRLAISYPRKRDGIRAGEVPISDPFAKYRRPHANKVNVTGTWGWTTVPADIEQAALLLIEERLCPESLYRERYIKSMSAADMKFEFAAQAYSGTGNVIADQILSSYVTSNSVALI